MKGIIMKRPMQFLTKLLIVPAILASSLPTMAISEATRKKACEEMCRASVPEKPARAVALVERARKEEKADIAVLCVNCVLAKAPVSATSVIAGICLVAPEVASAVAAALNRRKSAFAPLATMAMPANRTRVIANEARKA